MIQASIGNVREYDKVAEALIVQHPRIHLKEKPPSHGKGKGLRPKGRKRQRKRQASHVDSI